MIAVIIKNNPQLPPNPSTIAPEEDANNVLPAVPTEASKAYCVAVKLRSTRSDMNVTKATVAKAAARSSMITANANRIYLEDDSDSFSGSKNTKTIHGTLGKGGTPVSLQTQFGTVTINID